MIYKRFDDKIAVRLDKDESIIESLKKVCNKENVKAGYITGLGTSKVAEVGLYNVKEKKYYPNTLDKDLEITSIVGNISQMRGECYLHLHATFADENANVFGGHLTDATVLATCEIFINVVDGIIDRFHDDDTGLNLITF